MSVEMPPGYEVIHGNDLDTGLDSHQPGYELHIRPGYEAIHDDDLNLTHDWRDMSVTKPPHEIAESTIDHGDD